MHGSYCFAADEWTMSYDIVNCIGKRHVDRMCRQHSRNQIKKMCIIRMFGFTTLAAHTLLPRSRVADENTFYWRKQFSDGVVERTTGHRSATTCLHLADFMNALWAQSERFGAHFITERTCPAFAHWHTNRSTKELRRSRRSHRNENCADDSRFESVN